jgi:transcriptional regulator with XRE-family HTH domain
MGHEHGNIGTERPGELNFIRRRRLELGLTQKAVADPLHLNSAAVSEWERGKNLPGPAVLPGLAKVLRVSREKIVEELYGAISGRTNT